MVKIFFPYQKDLLLKEIIRSLLGQILFFKRSSFFSKGMQLKRINACSNSLPLMYITFSAFLLGLELAIETPTTPGGILYTMIF